MDSGKILDTLATLITHLESIVYLVLLRAWRRIGITGIGTASPIFFFLSLHFFAWSLGTASYDQTFAHRGCPH